MPSNAGDDRQASSWLGRPQARAHVLEEAAAPVAQNPILRGRLLTYLAEIVAYSTFVQHAVWRNAGFSTLRNDPKLAGIHPRLDPTVIKTRDNPLPKQTEAFQDLLSEKFDTRRRAGPSAFAPSVLDYHVAYKSGALTPTDVIEALLPLIKKDIAVPTKHATAFLETRADLVLRAAAASAQRYREGKPLSPLDGVPVAVKDEVDLKGYRRSLGSKLDYTNPNDVTTVCAEKWEDAGAIIIGKTNMHELGLDTTTLNPNHGTPINPYNDGFYCGGSSGGSAYVLGAGLVPVAHGADGGGSIRIPSSYCGMFGLKPSHNRISGRPTPSLATSVGVHGPMAANMVDLEISYRIMAQPDTLESTARLFTPPASTSTVRNKSKVLGIDQSWLNKAEPVVREAFQRTIDWLVQKRGYTVVEVTLPLLHEAQLAHAMTIVSEISAGVPDISKLTAPNKILLTTAGNQSSAVDLLQAQKVRAVLMEHLAHLYDRHPGLIIVSPTTPNAGWAINPAELTTGLSNGNMSIKSMSYVFVANFTGNPAVTCPVGYVPTSNGGVIPTGFMGMGDWCSEDELLAFGYELEDYLHNGLDGGRQRPQNWVDVLSLAKKESI